VEAPDVRLIVNGREREMDDGLDLVGLLRAHRLEPRVVVVEHNGRILRPAQMEGVDLTEGDRVEIVQLVGGG
jgi:sulfur carrier protein